MNGKKSRCPSAFDKHFAHAMTGRLGRDHYYVNVRWGLNGFEVDVETVSEEQRLVATGERWRDRLVVELGLNCVRRQNDEHVSPFRRLTRSENFKTSFACLRARAAGRFECDAYFDAAVAEIKRVSMSLRSVTKDGYFLPADQGNVCRILVIDFRHVSSSLRTIARKVRGMG